VGSVYAQPKTPGTAGVGVTLVEHWNGYEWGIVPSPSPGKTPAEGNEPASSSLEAVAALSPDNIWAVGEDTTKTSEVGLIEHWNGSKWKVVPSPVPGSFQQTLYGVAAVNARNIWAVGNFYAGDQSQPLAQRWNGLQWSPVATQHVNTASVSLNEFYGVTAQSASNVWAVGGALSKGFHALVEHWNGTKWVALSNPAAPYGNGILSGVSVHDNTVWAVGQQGRKRSPALIERFTSCPPQS